MLPLWTPMCVIDTDDVKKIIKNNMSKSHLFVNIYFEAIKVSFFGGLEMVSIFIYVFVLFISIRQFEQ